MHTPGRVSLSAMKSVLVADRYARKETCVEKSKLTLIIDYAVFFFICTGTGGTFEEYF